MNAICERLIGTLRREFLDRMPILNQAHLHAVLAEYQAHYNTARPHQGIDQRVPGLDRGVSSAIEVNLDAQRIRRRPVLSGLINTRLHARFPRPGLAELTGQPPPVPAQLRAADRAYRDAIDELACQAGLAA